VEMTNLKSLRAGDPVNLEADLIAKYDREICGENDETGSNGRFAYD